MDSKKNIVKHPRPTLRFRRGIFFPKVSSLRSQAPLRSSSFVGSTSPFIPTASGGVFWRRGIKNLPHACGVYLFKDNRGHVLYVGKAIDLARRVSSYFAAKPDESKSDQMLRRAVRVETIRTASEFDAIVLEAKLIFDFQPKYNVIAKDDKSRLYVRISLEDELPTLMFVRKPQSDAQHSTRVVVFIGPFQSSRVARSLLRQVRHVIPYCTQKKRNGTACFYTHLGLCNPCPSVLLRQKESAQRKRGIYIYRQNIFRLRDMLQGKSRTVRNALARDMNAASRKEFFEQATILRNHIRALDALQNRQYDPSLYMTSVHALSHIAKTELRDLEALLSITNAHSRTLRRIECMDISHLGGSWAAGSIVVATDGIIDSSQYRRFRVKVSSSDDLTMLEEVLRRRLRHDEWQKPDLLVTDGGKPQVGRILRVLEDLNQTIAVVGIAKQYEELIIPRNGMMRTLRLPLDRPVMMLIRRLRDEAHRFALRYQRILIRTQYRQSFV